LSYAAEKQTDKQTEQTTRTFYPRQVITAIISIISFTQSSE